MSEMMTKAELEEAVTTIWDRLLAGHPDSETMDLMGLDAETYNKLKAILLDKKTDELRKRPIEHVYVEYVLNQVQNIGALTDILASAKTDKNLNAAIAAVRARADIYDRLLVKGQEVGIFAKRPENGKQMSLARMLSDMTTDDLRVEVARAVAETARMMRKFGDHKIIDATPGDLHYGEALTEAKASPSEAVVAPRSKHAPPEKASKKARSKSSKTAKHARGRKAFRVVGGGSED